MPRLTPRRAKGTLLITRPQEDARPLQRQLRRKGYATRSEPMLAIEAEDAAAPLLREALARRPQAVIATSKHAVLAYAGMTKRRNLPLIVVGKATARLAERLGFSQVDMAGPRAQSLTRHVESRYTPQRGTLLYLRGHDISLDIAALLAQKAFTMESLVIYAARPATRLSASLVKALLAGTVTGALFFSRRTAATYVKLAQDAGLADCHRAIEALCMSESIAHALRPLPWHQIRTAAAPDREHMLALVKYIPL